MNYLLLISQIASAIILIVLILLQSKGTGLGATFGGDMGFYGTKRGAEKVLFMFTIFIGFVFIVTSLLGIIFQ